MWDDTRSAIDVARELPIGLPSVADREERRTALLAAWEPAQIASEVAAVQPARGLTPEPSSGETAFVDSLRARRRRRILAVVVAAAASLAAVMLAARGPLPPPSVVATHPRRGVVHPHEGAQFTLAAQPPDEIVRLRDGVIDIDVDPLMLGERFRVVVGADEVEVHGTSFQVVAAADRLVSVRVVHGRVEVRRIGAPPAFVIGGGAWHSTTVTGLESPAPPPTASVATTLPNRSSPPGRLPRGVIRPPGSSALDAVAQPPASTTAVPHRANPQEVAFARGWEAMGQGELGQAAASFQRAIALAPDGALAEDATFWHAVAVARLHRSSDAIGAFRAFLDGFPTSTRAGEASAMLGWLLIEAHELDEARLRFRAAENDPNADARASAQKGLQVVGGQ